MTLKEKRLSKAAMLYEKLQEAREALTAELVRTVQRRREFRVRELGEAVTAARLAYEAAHSVRIAPGDPVPHFQRISNRTRG